MKNTTQTVPDFRIDHTMLRVSDLERSLDFYVRILGMKILRQNEYPDGKFTNTFVGFQDEDRGQSQEQSQGQSQGQARGSTLELTYNWEQAEPYERGNAWGHIALKVSDVYAASAYLESQGVEFTKRPSPMKGGSRILAFIKDPDGYPIELNEPLGKDL